MTKRGEGEDGSDDDEELDVPVGGHRLQLGEWVERHLMDEDVVLLTRPPALRRESVQGTDRPPTGSSLDLGLPWTPVGRPRGRAPGACRPSLGSRREAEKPGPRQETCLGSRRQAQRANRSFAPQCALLAGRRAKIIYHCATMQPNVIDADQYHFDYDGDEMELFVPQTDAADIEAMELMSSIQSVVCEQDNSNHVHLHQGTDLFRPCQVSSSPRWHLWHLRIDRSPVSYSTRTIDELARGSRTRRSPGSHALESATTDAPYSRWTLGLFGSRFTATTFAPHPLFSLSRWIDSRCQGTRLPTQGPSRLLRYQIQGRFDKSVTGSGARSLITHMAHNYAPEHHQRVTRQLQKLGCLILQDLGNSIGIADLEEYAASRWMQQAKMELLARIQANDSVIPLQTIRREMDQIWERRMEIAGPGYQRQVLERLVDSGSKVSVCVALLTIWGWSLGESCDGATNDFKCGAAAEHSGQQCLSQYQTWAPVAPL